ncbi:MAG: hypothetical protein BGO10_06545 [Chlamydia sp. 32-24]|nr:MAG: hypothetical protein BGO10_06545 [Chlamydia sp. 32-24]
MVNTSSVINSFEGHFYNNKTCKIICKTTLSVVALASAIFASLATIKLVLTGNVIFAAITGVAALACLVVVIENIKEIAKILKSTSTAFQVEDEVNVEVIPAPAPSLVKLRDELIQRGEAAGLFWCHCCNKIREKLEKILFTLLSSLNLDKQSQVKLLSVGSGGLLQDYVFIGQLYKAGYRNISICLDEPILKESTLKDFRELFLSWPDLTIQIQHTREIPKDCSFNLCYAIDFDPILNNNDADSAWKDLFKAFANCKEDGICYIQKDHFTFTYNPVDFARQNKLDESFKINFYGDGFTTFESCVFFQIMTKIAEGVKNFSLSFLPFSVAEKKNLHFSRSDCVVEHTNYHAKLNKELKEKGYQLNFDLFQKQFVGQFNQFLKEFQPLLNKWQVKINWEIVKEFQNLKDKECDLFVLDCDKISEVSSFQDYINQVFSMLDNSREFQISNFNQSGTNQNFLYHWADITGGIHLVNQNGLKTDFLSRK